MKTYNAIDKVSEVIIKDGLCEAVVLKGSIGRGDDDEYSDVDMYAVVSETNLDAFLNRRTDYLKAYLPLVYSDEVNFIAPQIVAIYEDGLHFDLYTVTESNFKSDGKIKVVYDVNGKFSDYSYTASPVSPEYLSVLFKDSLYYFVEADSAYRRKNFPWAAAIMTTALKQSAVLLRSLYDRETAFLGLKKINELFPDHQFMWIEDASKNLHEKGFQTANEKIIEVLQFFYDNTDEECRKLLDTNFFSWIKTNLHTSLFKSS